MLSQESYPANFTLPNVSPGLMHMNRRLPLSRSETLPALRPLTWGSLACQIFIAGFKCTTCNDPVNEKGWGKALLHPATSVLERSFGAHSPVPRRDMCAPHHFTHSTSVAGDHPSTAWWAGDAHCRSLGTSHLLLWKVVFGSSNFKTKPICLPSELLEITFLAE